MPSPHTRNPPQECTWHAPARLANNARLCGPADTGSRLAAATVTAVLLRLCGCQKLPVVAVIGATGPTASPVASPLVCEQKPGGSTARCGPLGAAAAAIGATLSNFHGAF